MTNPLANGRSSSILGLSLTESCLQAVCVSRAREGTETTVKAPPLSIDLLKQDPSVLGNELRKHLDAAGIRESACVVALPPSWFLCQSTPVPDLPAEDLDSLLQLEAEKAFPCDASQLQVARSLCKGAGATFATQIAVNRERLGRLSAILESAQLKPLSYSTGLASLAAGAASDKDCKVVVAVDGGESEFMISAGGGVASLRSCETADLIRELKITAEQLPASLRQGLLILSVWGADSQLESALEASLAPARVDNAKDPRPTAEILAGGIASAWISQGAAALEFLPPKPDRWAALLDHTHSKRFAFVGAAFAAALFFIISSFAWQQYRLWTLRSEWSAMQVQVQGLDETQERVLEYRPWRGGTFHHLAILRRVTECFPDTGSVTARTFEVHGDSGVSIAGTARDNTALLHVLDQLRKSDAIQGLKVEEIHGKSPLQFTFSFKWTRGAGS